jgi:hypothetical protein
MALLAHLGVCESKGSFAMALFIELVLHLILEGTVTTRRRTGSGVPPTIGRIKCAWN